MEYDTIKDELLALLDSGLKSAKSVDSNAEYELFLYFENVSKVRIEQGAISSNAGMVAGVATRAAKNHNVGFACASGMNAERILLTIREAHAIADKVSAKDDRFKGFNENGKPAKEGILSDDIINIEVDHMVRDLQLIIDDARSVDEKVTSVIANAEASWSAHAVGNTRGVQVASRSGHNGCDAYVTSQDAEQRHNGYAYDLVRDRLYQHTEIGRNASKEALEQHGARKLDVTAVMPTLWSPYSAATFIQASLGQSILGQYIVQKMSPLCDRIGDVIAYNGFTLIDDGQDPRGWGTKAVDDEGHPQQTTSIIERGVLKSYLFNTYNAHALGLETTGNCGRGRGIFPDPAPYESTVSINPTTLKVKAGTKSFEDLVASIDEKTVLIKGFPIGIFHSSVSTGEFSAMANHALLIERGEIKGPVQSVSVAGNFYNGFKNIREIGADLEATELGATVPSILIDNLSVTG